MTAIPTERETAEERLLRLTREVGWPCFINTKSEVPRLVVSLHSGCPVTPELLALSDEAIRAWLRRRRLTVYSDLLRMLSAYLTELARE